KLTTSARPSRMPRRPLHGWPACAKRRYSSQSAPTAAALTSAGNIHAGARVTTHTKTGMKTTAVATRRSGLAIVAVRAGSIIAAATLAAISHPTESPGPALEVDEGTVEVTGPEVRPQRGRDPELRIRDLPEQKVRHAHLAAGADEKIGIGDVARVEGGAHVAFGNSGRHELARLHAYRQRAHRLHAFAVTGHARQPTPGRPPAVAVHDDGDVARDRVLTRTHEELTLGQRAELGPRRAATRSEGHAHSSY